jgi:hypothetical protein
MLDVETPIRIVHSQTLHNKLSAAKHVAFQLKFSVGANQPEVDLTRHLLQTLREHFVKLLMRFLLK